jgi:hypothetical protein
MGALFNRVRQLVIDGRYVVGQHATERLEERGILEWQIVDGVAGGILLRERPESNPNPAIEVRQLLADGTDVTAVWSVVIAANFAKLVTVYFTEE